MENKPVTSRRGFSNQARFIAAMLTYSVAVNMMSGGYIQAFMLNLGLGAGDVTLHGVTSTASALAAYCMFSLFRPKGGRYFGTMVVNAFLMVLYPVLLLCSALLGGRSALMLILAGVVLYSLASAFKSSAEFATIPYLFPRREYGRIVGKGASIGCLIAAGISVIGSAVLSTTAGNTGYVCFFAISAVSMLLSALITMRYRPAQEQTYVEQESAASGGVDIRRLLARLGDRAFLWRMLPHLLRGAGMAGLYYFPLVGMTNAPLNAAQSGYLIVISVAAQLLGNLTFMRLSQKVRSGWLVIVPFGIAVTCMLAVPFVHSVPVFMGLYFVVMTASCVSDSGIPQGVMRSTSLADLPLVSSLRMVASSGMNCILVMVLGWMIEVSPFAAMAVSAAVYMVGGVLYFAQFRDQMDEQT